MEKSTKPSAKQFTAKELGKLLADNILFLLIIVQRK